MSLLLFRANINSGLPLVVRRGGGTSPCGGVNGVGSVGGVRVKVAGRSGSRFTLRIHSTSQRRRGDCVHANPITGVVGTWRRFGASEISNSAALSSLVIRESGQGALQILCREILGSQWQTVRCIGSSGNKQEQGRLGSAFLSFERYGARSVVGGQTGGTGRGLGEESDGLGHEEEEVGELHEVVLQQGQVDKATIMAEESVAEELVAFINASPTAFHAVRESKSRLKKAGFVQLSEKETWKLEFGGKYYFTRNHSTLVAFAIGKRYEAGKGFLAIGAHTDSPCPKLKPISKVTKGGFLEIGVQTYGGGLWHTWFDRDLTVAGRVVVKRLIDGEESFSHELVRVTRPILRIPTLAIHLDRGIMEQGFKVNTQNHLVPVLATAIKSRLVTQEDPHRPASSSPLRDANGEPEKFPEKKIPKIMNHHPLLLQVLADELNSKVEDISTFDLDVVDTQPSSIGGALKEFIFSARLDNLCSSFCALKALIDATSSEVSLDEETGVRMIALFDHEEIGSNSAQGAGSPVLVDALRRVTTQFSSTSSSDLLEQAIQKSFLVSADMAHALHPNYQDKHEENHQPKIHSGTVIKHNANQRYATNAVTAFLFREIGHRNKIPTQDFVVRNDMACGSTIGPILASGIGIRTVDVGTPQLSMHSVREMCGVDDVGYSYMHYKAFFECFTQLDARLSVDD